MTVNKDKWVVCDDTQYYPFVSEYDTLEEANENYEKLIKWCNENVYLCKVIKHTEAE